MEELENENIKDLVFLAKSGDDEAFARLYGFYFTPVFRYIFLRTKDKNLSEDISQEVFLKSFKVIDRFQERGRPFLAYLFTIAKNEVIDYWKKSKEIIAEDKVLDYLDFSEDKTISLIENNELNLKILEAVNKLSEEKKEVILLKYFGDLKSFEVAEIIGKNESAVRKMQSRALKELREILSK